MRYYTSLVLGVLLVMAVAVKSDYALWGDPRTITKVSTSHKVIAVTIDDGPHTPTTQEILSVLRQKKVKATFFVLGVNVQRHPELVTQELADGHEIAVHAFDHKPLTNYSKDRIIEEFIRMEQVLSRLSVEKPYLFRPPGGAFNETVIAAAQEKGYSVILWDIDSLDWTRPSVNTIISNVTKNIHPGSIILFHDGQYPLPTPQALSILIDILKEQDYEFLTVSELLRLSTPMRSDLQTMMRCLF